jgi:hypothetical protein
MVIEFMGEKGAKAWYCIHSGSQKYVSFDEGEYRPIKQKSDQGIY